MWEKLTNKKARDVIAKVGDPFKGLPHLPQYLIEFFVKITPWGVGLAAFFSLIGAFTNLRFGLGMNPISKIMNLYVGVNPAYFLLTAVLQLALAALAFKAFALLRNKKIEGWIYLFWSNAIAVLEGLIGLVFLGGSGISLLFGALIGYYLLFEIKPAYEPKKKVEAKKKKTDKN